MTSSVGYINNVIINNGYILIRTCGLSVKLWALFKSDVMYLFRAVVHTNITKIK